MEKVKKFIALLGMVGLMALLPLGSVAAHAAEPETAVSWRFYESEVLKEEVTDISVSPDGESISFTTEDGEKYVVDGLTDEQYERVGNDIKNLNKTGAADEKETDNNEDSISIQKLIGVALFTVLFFIGFFAVLSFDL